MPTDARSWTFEGNRAIVDTIASPAQSSLLPPTSFIPLVYCPTLTSTSLSTAFSLHILPRVPPVIQPRSPPDTQPLCSNLSLSTIQVRNKLWMMKVKKATGPDGISYRLLKSCTDQLCRIVRHLFNMTLNLRVPMLWNTSCVVPVPKTPHSKHFNSYRAVTLTSHLILVHLHTLVSPFMDPFQFA